MPHLVEDWMSSPVIVIDPDSSVAHGLTLMRRRGIRSLVVNLFDDNQTYGIVTTTDIRNKIIAQDWNPAETTIREIMTAPVISAKSNWTLKQCSVKMQEHNIHHLPVVDEAGELIGMISDTDIFMAAEEIGWHAAS